MKKIIAILLCFVWMNGIHSQTEKSQQPRKGGAVQIEQTADLNIYHIDFDKIELYFGQRPESEQVVYCAEAAYTNKPFGAKFAHKRIAGPHAGSGVKYKGGESPYYSGAFTYYQGHWHFHYNTKYEYNAVMDSAADCGGMGFCQSMIIYHKALVRQTRPSISQKEYYRTLCQKDGKLMIIDTREKISFGRFTYLLVEMGIEDAIYMDMGSGWNHSWYRDEEGKKIEIFPKTHNCCTNWIGFIKK